MRDPWAPNYLMTRTVGKAGYSAARRTLGVLYFLRDDERQRVKIGYSTDPGRRKSQLQVGSSSRLRFVALIAAEPEVEHVVHRQLDEWHLQGEWFDDRWEQVSEWVERMTGKLRFGESIWWMSPGVSEVVEEGKWTRIYSRPDPSYVPPYQEAEAR